MTYITFYNMYFNILDRNIKYLITLIFIIEDKYDYFHNLTNLIKILSK